MSTPWERLKVTLAMNAMNHRRVRAGRLLTKAMRIVHDGKRHEERDLRAMALMAEASRTLWAAWGAANKIIEYRLQGGLTTDD